MFDVWIIDFVANDKRLWKSGVSWKKAKKLAKKLNRKDRFSTALVVPFGFSLFCPHV
jgi:hypothetical protein